MGALPETTVAGLRLRGAQRADAPLILQFIRELAEYEKLSHELVADTAQIERTLFDVPDAPRVLFACLDGEPVGFALYFRNYSTFLARPGLYLEDLYVRPAARGRGIGRALLAALAREAVEQGCGRMEWAVLDWNESAINFYRSLGALPQDEWTVYRVTGEGLRRLAQGTGAD
jgi:GNAT superfamily N-acetyltransferase